MDKNINTKNNELERVKNTYLKHKNLINMYKKWKGLSVGIGLVSFLLFTTFCFVFHDPFLILTLILADLSASFIAIGGPALISKSLDKIYGEYCFELDMDLKSFKEMIKSKEFKRLLKQIKTSEKIETENKFIVENYHQEDYKSYSDLELKKDIISKENDEEFVKCKDK